MVKVGIDGGGSFLKFCLNLIKTDDSSRSEPVQKRLKYSEGAFQGKFIDSGVKKLLLIAITEDVKESYDNVNPILDLLKLDRVEFMSAFDLKLANVYLGIGTHSSTYPCPWCETAKKDFSNPNRQIKLRTLGMIRENAAKFQDEKKRHRSKNLSAAAYKSCIHEPLAKNLPDDTLVIDLLPVMELHLLLGITNRLYNHADTILSAVEGTTYSAKDWSDQLGIRRPPLHSGEVNGNQCKRLLDNISILKTLLEDANTGAPGQKVFNTFEKFNLLRKACFGMICDENYQQAIVDFQLAYSELHISVTSKCHAAFDHIHEFLERQRRPQEDPIRGLGFWSEQASEAVHSDFSALWHQHYKRDRSHANYGKFLLKAVVTL
ncbi:hypothetical protein SNE40_019926 [Patella caerulea]|uniref:Uncharacterized protein n=1 Tax=Patella caerulea TaxID=87958 RepID=A0AAN8GD87_PATCE